MEDNENLAFKERSLEELIGHLSSDVQKDGQYNRMRIPPSNTPPSQGFAPEYQCENLDPAFLQRRNVYIQDNYESHQRGSLPFFVNPTGGDVPEMMHVRGGDYVFYGTPNGQKNQPVPNIHFYNKTNGTLTGFNDYGVEYSGGAYDIFNGISFQRHGSATQFPHNPKTNTKAQLIENLVGNWTSDQSGTYSPFGSSLGGIRSDAVDNIGIGRGSRKTRIVAEVRPMRPSYSDVLSKSILNNQKQNQKTGQDMKQKMNEMKTKPSKYSAGRTLSGNGNLLNRQLSPCADESGFISNSNLKGSNLKKIDCENEGKESLSKKWLSLDDLKNAAKRESYISLNDVKNKKNSPKNLNNKTNAYTTNGNNNNNNNNNNKKAKWDSAQLNNSKDFNVKPQVSKKQEKQGNAKIQTGLREKENISAQKLENVRSKATEERRATSGNQSKAEQVKSTKRVARNCQPEKHKKTIKNKRREQEPCISAMIRCRVDRYVGVLLFALNWLLRLVLDVLGLSTHLAIHMCAAIWASSVLNATQSYNKFCRSIKNIEILQRIMNSRFFPFKKADSKKKTFESDDESDDLGEPKVRRKIPRGLKHNISLPVTGDEAMKRLLACKGKDPYSILGVTHDCTDDDIKKYYKRQAFLVHPDKNNQPGAEEAFKILVHAFDIIGEPEHRKSYDRRMEKTQVEQAAWSELSDLLSKLHKKMEYVANTIKCTNCNKRHKRTTVDRPIYAARMCNQCKIHHAVREGDIWAETSLFGLLWHYYACMDGAVYDITEWAGCQGSNLRNLKANTHNVQYRIVLGKQHGQKQKYQHPTPTSEPDFEDFINNFYTKSDSGAGGADGDRMSSKKRKTKKKK